MTKNIRLTYLHNFLTDFRPQWPFLAIYCAQITGSYPLLRGWLNDEQHAASSYRIFVPYADLFSSVLRSILAVRETLPYVIIVNPDATAIRNRLHLRFSVLHPNKLPRMPLENENNSGSYERTKAEYFSS